MEAARAVPDGAVVEPEPIDLRAGRLQTRGEVVYALVDEAAGFRIAVDAQNAGWIGAFHRD